MFAKVFLVCTHLFFHLNGRSLHYLSFFDLLYTTSPSQHSFSSWLSFCEITFSLLGQPWSSFVVYTLVWLPTASKIYDVDNNLLDELLGELQIRNIKIQDSSWAFCGHPTCICMTHHQCTVAPAQRFVQHQLRQSSRFGCEISFCVHISLHCTVGAMDF